MLINKTPLVLYAKGVAAVKGMGALDFYTVNFTQTLKTHAFMGARRGARGALAPPPPGI